MRKFSDVERYEVELIDESGKKRTFKARARCFTLLDELDEMKKRYKDVKDERKLMESDYEAIAILFGVPSSELKSFSHDLIIQVSNDYTEYRTKKLLPQEKKGQAN